MESKLEWLNEEEGTIRFLEEACPVVQVYVTGGEEAEFRLQDIVFPKDLTENEKTRKEIICKVTKSLKEAFRLMWDEGYEETVLVEQKGSELGKILDSTCVVEKVYSECLMYRRFETKKTTDSSEIRINLIEEEEGLLCENEEKTFFCRLLPYSAKNPGENCFYLYEVEVKQNKRNKGIATACLEELFRQLAKETPVSIYLQVGSYNEPAVHLYEKLGFEVSEELCYYALAE